MAISVRRKALLGELVSWAGFLLLTVFVSGGLGLAFFFITGWSAGSLTCPQCDKPLFQRSRRLFGVTWTYYSATFPRRYCTRCGFDLNTPTVHPLPVSRHSIRTATSGTVEDFTLSAALFLRWPVRRIAVVAVFIILTNVIGIALVFWRGAALSFGWPLLSGAALIGAVLSGAAVLLLLTARCHKCRHRLRGHVFRSHCPRCRADLRIDVGELSDLSES
jgi:hypothetical protein